MNQLRDLWRSDARVRVGLTVLPLRILILCAIVAAISGVSLGRAFVAIFAVICTGLVLDRGEAWAADDAVGPFGDWGASCSDFYSFCERVGTRLMSVQVQFCDDTCKRGEPCARRVVLEIDGETYASGAWHEIRQGDGVVRFLLDGGPAAERVCRMLDDAEHE